MVFLRQFWNYFRYTFRIKCTSKTTLSNGPRGLTSSLVPATALSGKPTNFPNQHLEWALSMGVWGLQVTKTHTHNCFKNISLLGAFSKLIKRFVRKPKPDGILCLFCQSLCFKPRRFEARDTILVQTTFFLDYQQLRIYSQKVHYYLVGSSNEKKNNQSSGTQVSKNSMQHQK